MWISRQHTSLSMHIRRIFERSPVADLRWEFVITGIEKMYYRVFSLLKRVCVMIANRKADYFNWDELCFVLYIDFAT